MFNIHTSTFSSNPMFYSLRRRRSTLVLTGTSFSYSIHVITLFSSFIWFPSLSYFYFVLAVDCGPLHAPTNGSLHGTLTTFPNTLSFTCDKGFLLRGSELRACQANRTWSGLGTTCPGKVMIPP